MGNYNHGGIGRSSTVLLKPTEYETANVSLQNQTLLKYFSIESVHFEKM